MRSRISCKSFPRGLLSLALPLFLLLLAGPAPAGVESYRTFVQGTDGLRDYYTFDENFLDSFEGDNGLNNGRVPGPPPFGAGVGEGKSITCEGGYLTITRSIQDDFTIVAWIKTTTRGAAGDADQFWQGSGLIYADVPGAGNDFGTAITGGTFGFGVGPGPGGAADTTIHSTTLVTSGEWIQVAAVRKVETDLSIATITVYLNGIPEATIDHTNIAPLDGSAVIYLGGNVLDGRLYTGSLDEVALFEVALDEAAVQGLYDEMDSGVAAYRELVQDTAGLVDYYDFEDDYADAFAGSNGSNDGLPPDVGTTVPIFDVGLNDEFQAAVFDGVDDAFNVNLSITEDFSIVAWLRTSVPQIGNDASAFYEGSGFIYADVGGVANDFGTAITGTKFAFGVGNPDATAHSVSAMNTDEWIHVAAVRERDPGGAGAVLSIYLNGELEATLNHLNVSPVNAAAALTIGANLVDRRYYTGMMDEVALFGVALDSDTVSSIYSSLTGLLPCYTADATEGTEPLTVVFDGGCTTSSGSPIVSFTWDFGDGTDTEQGQKVSHVFNAVGKYSVRMTVENERQDTASVAHDVTVNFRSGDVSPWTSEDIGAVAGPGGARFDDPCYVVYAQGGNFAGMNDIMHFVHRTASGDGKLSAKVGLDSGIVGAKAGLFLREGIAASTGCAGMFLQKTTDTGAIPRFAYRTKAGTMLKTVAQAEVQLPVWIQIERTGNEFIGSLSADGTQWTEVGRITLDNPALAADLEGGVAAAGMTQSVRVSACGLVFGFGGGKVQFRRGDSDGKGGVPNITDGIFVLNFLFLGGSEPPCKEAANADDKGGINITDGIYILNYLFQGGPAPPAPGPDACGPEPEGSQDDVGCGVYDKC